MFLIAVGELTEEFITSRAVQIIICSAISAIICQLYKFIYYSIKYKKFEWFMLVSTGGFPSSHTSLVITLAVLLGLFEHHDMRTLDYSFAVSVVFAGVTIHDAMGVRYEASKHAIILNKMVDNLSDEEKMDLGFGKNGKLKEMLGHRGTEVLGGMLIGMIVAFTSFYILK